MVQAVIFDVDGTLIDSVDLHARAWQETLLSYGVRTDFQTVRGQIGKGGDKLMKAFLSKEQIAEQGKRIEEDRSKLFTRDYLPRVEPFPELTALFERLRVDGIKIALATSAKDEELQTYKKITGIEPFLAEESSSDDVSNSKPDPDIFLAAQKKLGIEPRNIIAVGDTRYDVESAAKAGMETIGLSCGGSSPAELRAAGCVALYRNPADLLKHYSRSPIAHRLVRSGLFSRSGSNDTNSSFPLLLGVGVGAAVGMLCARNYSLQRRGSEPRNSEERHIHPDR